MMLLLGIATVLGQIAADRGLDVQAVTEAERLVLERHPSSVIQSLEIEREYDESWMEVEFIVNGRRGALTLRHKDGRWRVEETAWRSTSSRYRRLLSRIESQPRGVQLGAVAATVLDAYPDATISGIELEFEDAPMLYEIELLNGPEEFEVEVDAITGQLLNPPASVLQPGRIRNLLAALTRSDERGTPVGFLRDPVTSRFVIETRCEDESARQGLELSQSIPPCNELRTKLELLSRIFPEDSGELLHGQLTHENGWVLRLVKTVGGQELHVRVDGYEQSVLVRIPSEGAGS